VAKEVRRKEQGAREEGRGRGGMVTSKDDDGSERGTIEEMEED
jgi:hypothetical protein